MIPILNRTLVCGGLMLITGLGCSSPDVSGPISTDLTQLYWAMTLDAHAITMSTAASYNTLQLTATPRTFEGAALVSDVSPTFTSSDSSVRVSATGLLTARAVKNNVKIVASLTYQGIRLADTAVVNVTSAASPPAFRQLAFQLPPGDSILIAAPRWFSFFYFSSSKQLRVGALDSLNRRIPGSIVALRTSDILQATAPAVTAVAPATPTTTLGTVNVAVNGTTSRLGSVTIYATATVYGVTMQDSVQLTITTPLFSFFTLTKEPPPGGQTPVFTITPSFSETIGVGGVIWWINGSADSLDIVFDDPTAASEPPPSALPPSSEGDIASFAGAGGPTSDLAFVRARQFLRAGTFHFHSPRTGVSGTIIVQ